MSGLRSYYVFLSFNKTAVKKDWSFATNGFSRNPEIILPITPTPGHRAERFNFSRKSFSCGMT
jgi:hypothetical protein